MAKTRFSATRVHGEQSWFDRFADEANGVASNAPFFIGCVAFVVGWLALAPFLGFSKEWALALHLPIEVVTLLMVALLGNEQRRSDQAVHRKLNAVAGSLAEFMDESHVGSRQVDELRAAVGLENRESTRMTAERAARIADARRRRERGEPGSGAASGSPATGSAPTGGGPPAARPPR